MTRINRTQNSKKDDQLGQVDKLIAAAINPRDRAFIALLSRSGVRISEAIQIKESDIDFTNETLTIVHLKERLKLKCPNCGELLGKRHLFCPGCGEKVSQAIREEIEQRRQRMIPIDHDTLRLIKRISEVASPVFISWAACIPFYSPAWLAIG